MPQREITLGILRRWHYREQQRLISQLCKT